MLTSLVLLSAALAEAKMITLADCKATSGRAVYSKVILQRDDQLPFDKNLTVIATKNVAGSLDTEIKKLDYGFDSNPTGLRLKLHDDSKSTDYLFSSTIGGNFSGKGGTKVYAISIEDKQKAEGSLGSQLEFLSCK